MKPAVRKIPLIRPTMGKEELEGVRRVLESGWLAQGPVVREFEEKLANYLGAKHVVATNSCTSALSLALESLNLKPGSEVVVPDFTFPATANVVVRAGLKPVIADVSRETYAITPEILEEAITPRTSAVIPVDPFGFPIELDEIYELAEKRGIEVVEDAATALGTIYKGRKVGNRGRAVCFSFHPRKVMTTGEGGCVATDDEQVHELASALKNHGQVYRDGKPTFRYNGLNYRMSDINAAVGVAQLAKFGKVVASRREKAALYVRLLRDIMGVQLQKGPDDSEPTFQSFVMTLGKGFRTSRDECIKLMLDRFGVETQLGTYSMSCQPAFAHSKQAGKLTNGPALFRNTLTLPLFDSITDEQQHFVTDSLAEIARG